jgi:hypothetical protein
MDAKQFLLSKGIFDYQYIVDYDGESIELEKLLTDYAKALQLQQTGVIKSVCKHCTNHLCDSQTFNQQCFKCGKKPQ